MIQRRFHHINMKLIVCFLIAVINTYTQYLWINLCLSTDNVSDCNFFNLLDIQNGSLHHKPLVPIHDDYLFPLPLKFYDVSS